MKKIVLFAGLSIFLASCGNDNLKLDENGEYVEKTKRDEIMESAAKIEESGAYTDVAFNDGLLAEITLLDLKYEELADMSPNEDGSNIKEFTQESVNKADEVIANIKNIEGIGIGADALKQSGLNVAESFKNFASNYLAAGDLITLPDDQWTDADFENWTNLVETPNNNYLNAYNAFVAEQDNFFAMNNISVRETIDAAAIYEEEKAAKEEQPAE